VAALWSRATSRHLGDGMGLCPRALTHERPCQQVPGKTMLRHVPVAITVVRGAGTSHSNRCSLEGSLLARGVGRAALWKRGLNSIVPPFAGIWKGVLRPSMVPKNSKLELEAHSYPSPQCLSHLDSPRWCALSCGVRSNDSPSESQQYPTVCHSGVF
jgi:hypothetical protein